MRRELVEANANTSTRNPLSISIVRAIRYKRERVPVTRSAVVVKKHRAEDRFLMNQCRQEVFLMKYFPSNGFRGCLHKGELLEKGLL